VCFEFVLEMTSAETSAAVVEEDFDAEEEYSFSLSVLGWLVRASRGAIDAAFAAPLTRIISVYQCQVRPATHYHLYISNILYLFYLAE
jgi:hypothetical protein